MPAPPSPQASLCPGGAAMGPKRQRSRDRLFAVAEGLPEFEALAEVATKRNLCLAIAVHSHVRLLLSRKDLVQPPASTRRNGCARRALEAGTFEAEVHGGPRTGRATHARACRSGRAQLREHQPIQRNVDLPRKPYT